MLYTEDAITMRMKKAQRNRKIISIIAYILLIPLLIYNIALIVQAVTSPNKTPSFLGLKTYTIISGSMEPEIKIGDIVIVKEISDDKLKNGDIISFRQGQSVVTHRIVDINKNEKKYITKGDNNNVEDSQDIDFALIEGKVICKIPFLGKIAQMLQGKITVIVIALMAYIYFSHASKINSIKNRRKVKRMRYEEENEQK